jgi:protein-disulfide isomerase
MKFGVILTVAAAALACSGPLQAAPAKGAHSKAIARDWTQIVSTTPAGGFVMGNPDAKVKLLELGSMTCSHCKVFDEAAVPNIINGYVKTGKISFEFRNYVRDASDVAASTIARCAGTTKFFPLTRALYKEQESWQAKVENTPQDKLNVIQELPPSKEFFEIAKAAGLQQWAAQRGLPVAKSTKCLTDEAAIKRLIQITQDTKTKFPDFMGTPTFVINGSIVDLGAVTEAEVWPALESKIKEALGTQG